MKLCTFSKREKIRGLHLGDISPCYYVLRYAIAYLNVSFRKYNSKRKERGMAVKYENEVRLGEGSLNFVMPCWSEYDKGFPITKRTPCNGKVLCRKRV